jgi:hypothetical protein
VDYHLRLFVDNDRQPAVTLTFSEENHKSMSEVIMALHAACSGTYQTCEVWHGGVCVYASTHDRVQTWATMVDNLRRTSVDRVIAMTETLMNCEDAIARSQAVMAVADKLRGRLFRR